MRLCRRDNLPLNAGTMDQRELHVLNDIVAQLGHELVCNLQLESWTKR